MGRFKKAIALLLVFLMSVSTLSDPAFAAGFTNSAGTESQEVSEQGSEKSAKVEDTQKPEKAEPVSTQKAETAEAVSGQKTEAAEAASEKKAEATAAAETEKKDSESSTGNTDKKVRSAAKRLPRYNATEKITVTLYGDADMSYDTTDENWVTAGEWIKSGYGYTKTMDKGDVITENMLPKKVIESGPKTTNRWIISWHTAASVLDKNKYTLGTALNEGVTLYSKSEIIMDSPEIVKGSGSFGAFEYDGTVHALTISNQPEEADKKYILGGTYSATDAGTYTAVITFPIGYVDNEGNRSITEDWTITKRSVKVIGESVTAETREYDGTKDVKVSGGDLDRVAEGDDGKVTVLDAGARGTIENPAVGTKPVEITGYLLTGEKSGNYELSEQPQGVKVTITQKAMSSSNTTITLKDARDNDITASGKHLVYNGQGQEPAKKEAVANDAPLAELTYEVTYYAVSDVGREESLTTPVDAGDYVAVFSFTGNCSGSVDKEFTIEKANPTITVENTTIHYNDRTGKFEKVFYNYAVEGIEGTPDGTVVASSSDTDVATVTKNASENAVDVKTLQAEKTFELTINASETPNYKAATVTKTITIEKGVIGLANNAPVAGDGWKEGEWTGNIVDGFVHDGWTYDGKKHPLGKVVPDIEGADTVYAYSEGDLANSEKRVTEENLTTGLAANKYRRVPYVEVWYKITKPNYEDMIGCYQINVEKKKVTVDLSNQAKNYGDPDPDAATLRNETNLTFFGFVENPDETAIYENEAKTRTNFAFTREEGKDAGTYKYTISYQATVEEEVKDDHPYYDFEFDTDAILTINKRAITVRPKADLATSGITYDDAISTIEVPGNVELSSGSFVTSAGSEADKITEVGFDVLDTDAGDQTITPDKERIKIKASDGTDVTKNYEITPAAGTLKINQRSIATEDFAVGGLPASTAYNGKTQKPTVTLAWKNEEETLKDLQEASDDSKDFKVEYFTDEECSVAAEDVKNAGTYHVRISGTKNYTGIKKLTYTIDQCEPVLTPDTETYEIVYNNDSPAKEEPLAYTYDNPAGSEIEGSPDGTKVEASVPDENATCTIDKEQKKITITPKKTGTFTLTITASSTTNYKGVTKTVTVIVSAADIGEIHNVPTAENNYKTYNATELDLYNTALQPTYGGKDLTGCNIQYVVKDHKVTTAETEAEHFYDTATTEPKGKDAGTYYVYYKVTRNNFKTKTGFYTFTINPAELKIATGSATKEYTGAALLGSTSHIDNNDSEPNAKITGLKTGDSADIVATGTVTDVDVSGEAGVDNTYKITWGEGTKESNYVIKPENVTLGKLKITKNTTNAIRITPALTQVTYNGENQLPTEAEWEGVPTGNGLKTSQTLKAANGVDNKNVTPDAGVDIEVASYKIIDRNGKDVTEWFNTATCNTGKLIIAPKELTITGIKAIDKEYDGSTTAKLEADGDNTKIEGMIESDEVSIDYSNSIAAFADADVDSGKTVTISKIALDGAQANNYVISESSQKTAVASIGVKKLQIKNAVVADRDYDGTKNVAVTNGTLDGYVEGDDVDLVSRNVTGTIESPDAGENKAVTVTYEIIGSKSRNYELEALTTLTVTIGKKAVTVDGITAIGKEYDGTDAAALTPEAEGSEYVKAAVHGLVDGESLKVSAAGNFNNKIVGSEKLVTIKNIVLQKGNDNTNPDNYELNSADSQSTTTADITAKQLGVTAKATDRVYNGDVAVEVKGELTGGVIEEDAVALTSETVDGTVADANASDEKPLATVGAFALTGDDAGNYELTQPTANSITVKIKKRPVTVSGITAVSKEYDRTPAAALTEDETDENCVQADLAEDDVVEGEALKVKATGIFTDAKVGTGKTVTISNVTLESGNGAATNADNYEVNEEASQKKTTANITAKGLTITGAKATNRKYDGTKNVTVSGGELSGVVEGDTVTLSDAEAKGTIDNEAVGDGKPVTVTGYTIGGTDADNYTLTQPQPADVTVNITQMPTKVVLTKDGEAVAEKLTATYPDEVKVDTAVIEKTEAGKKVDSSAAATISTADVKVYEGDWTLEQTAEKMPTDKMNPTMSDGSLTLAMNAAGRYMIGTYTVVVKATMAETNYSQAEPAILKVEVKPGTIEIAEGTQKNLTYDGALQPLGLALTTDPKTSEGLRVTYSEITGKTPGGKITYTLENEIPKEKDAGEYTVRYLVECLNYKTASGSYDINIQKKQVTVSGITADSKTYDETIRATLKYDAVEFDGIVAGDDLTVTAEGTFADANVGEEKTVAISALTLGGKDAGNYEIQKDGNQATTTAAITAKPINTDSTTADELPELTYNGKDQLDTIKAKLRISDKLTDDLTATLVGGEDKDYTVKYYSLKETEPKEVTAVTEVGNYKAVITGTGNFKDTKEVEFAIAPSTPLINAENAEVTYNGGEAAEETIDFTYEAPEGVTPAPEGTITVASSDETVATVALSEEDAKKIVVTPKKTGEFTLTISAEAKDNYAAATKTITVTVKEGTFTVEEVPAKDLVYTGKAQGLGTVKASIEGVKTTYQVKNFDTEAKAAAEATDAETYTVEYTVKKANYVDVTGSFEAAIAKAKATVTTDGAKKVYDGKALTASGIKVEGLVNDEKVSAAANGTQTIAGTSENTYAIAWDDNDSTAKAGNYEIEDVLGKLEVTKKPITVTAEDQEIFYGDAIKEGVDQVKTAEDALVGEDAISAVTLTASDDEKTIIPSKAVIKNADKDVTGNYEITYANGTLTVKEIPIELDENVTAKDLVYTGEAQELGHAVVKSPEGTTIKYGVDTKTCDQEKAAATDAGTHTVYYEVSGEHSQPKTGSFEVTIAKAPLTITTGSKDKIYDGEKLTEISSDVTGLVNKETITVTTNGKQTKVGESKNGCTIEWGTAKAANYEVTVTEGTLKVNPKEVTVTTANRRKVYGEKDPVFAAKVEGLIGTDRIEYHLDRTKGENAGTYDIIVSAEELQGNYKVTGVNAKLEIEKALPTISAELKSTASEGVKTQLYTVTTTNTDSDVAISASSSNDNVAKVEMTKDGLLVTPVTAGTISVYVDTNETANFKSTFTEISVTVDLADMTVTVPETKTVAYNEQAQTPDAVTAKAGDAAVSITYATEEKGSYKKEVPSFADAGEHVVYFKAEASGYKTQKGSYKFVIEGKKEEEPGESTDPVKAADITLTPTTAEEANYEPYSMIVDGKELYEGIDYDITYTYDPDGTTGKAKIEFKGNYSGTVEKEFKQPEYKVTTNADVDYTKGSDLLLQTNANMARFNAGSKNILVDNVKISDSDYTVDEATGAFYLKDSYLSTLAAGEHEITIYMVDGKASTKVTVLEKKEENVNPTPAPQPTPQTETKTAEQIKKENIITINAGLKVSQPGKKIKVAWGKVAGAAKYSVYVQYCGKGFKKAVKTVSNSKTSVTVTKVNGKKLNLKKNYKIKVVATDSSGKELCSTIIAHIVGRKNAKYTNVKKVTVSKANVTLSVGGTSKIKAKTTKVNKKRKELTNAHAKKFRYASDNEAVAKVSAGGVITAVGKGTCTVYVYARNGYAKKVTVTVQ